jgi:hypothetical protein
MIPVAQASGMVWHGSTELAEVRPSALSSTLRLGLEERLRLEERLAGAVLPPRPDVLSDGRFMKSYTSRRDWRTLPSVTAGRHPRE